MNLFLDIEVGLRHDKWYEGCGEQGTEDFGARPHFLVIVTELWVRGKLSALDHELLWWTRMSQTIR